LKIIIYLSRIINNLIYIVDDGSNGEYGVEIPFRAALENELSKGYSLNYYKKVNSLNTEKDFEYYRVKGISNSIPIVLVVVQGDLSN
jgi:hypothetical protein